MGLGIGQMRDIIEIHTRSSVVKDTYTVDDYVPVKTTRAYVAPAFGAASPLEKEELFESGAEINRSTINIVLRFTPLLTPDCRIKINGKFYEVKSVADIDNRHRFLYVRIRELCDG